MPGEASSPGLLRTLYFPPVIINFVLANWLVLSYQVLWFQDVRGKLLPAFLKCISIVWAEGTQVPSLLFLLIPTFTKQPHSTCPCWPRGRWEPSLSTSAPLPADFIFLGGTTIYPALQTGNPGGEDLRMPTPLHSHTDTHSPSPADITSSPPPHDTHPFSPSSPTAVTWRCRRGATQPGATTVAIRLAFTSGR